MTTSSTSRARSARAIIASAHLLFACVYIVIFAARYGYSPLIIPLHIAQVALGLVVLGLLANGAVAIAGRHARVIITLIGATASSLYLVVLIG